ncbi:MAG: peroxiredoxin [Planctomycetota bacterium]
MALLVRLVFCLGVTAAVFPAAGAAEKVGVGDLAPAFVAVDDSGGTWDSADHFGEGIVVLYFYPADMTGGCTAQACAYRDAKDEFDGLGVTVVGVSGDTAENHRLFKQAHDLNFALLADPEGEIAAKFGVPFNGGEKSLTREILGVEHVLTRGGTSRRWTFVIDADGRIAAVDDAVKAKKDAANVRKVIAGLSR